MLFLVQTPDGYELTPLRRALCSSLIGAMYLEFPEDEGTDSAVIKFVESAGVLLGGLIAQQSLIESAREDLRVERAKDHQEHFLDLDELLAATSMSGIRKEVRAAIAGRAAIMILGESGTGKTQLAAAAENPSTPTCD